MLFTRQMAAGIRMPMRSMLICLVLLSFGRWGYAQNNKFPSLTDKVTFSAKTSDAATLVEALQKQTTYSFYMDKAALSGVSLHDLHFQNVSLGRVLQYLQEYCGLSFMLNGKTIAVSRDPDFKPTRHAHQVTGRVVDSKTGAPISGVDIQEDGSRSGAVTDANGRFSLYVSDSSSVVTFSSVGYDARSVHAEDAAALEVRLVQDSKSLGTITVQAYRKVNTEAALLSERQHASIVMDGISAQNIEKTASITTTQALQRVSGVTITDDKYVAVRGLGDRSVIAEMNGVRMSSADPDRSSIPLDLIPANLLDNIEVYKTYTPDHPADASGGIVELKTKSIPDKQVLDVTVETGWNSNIGIGGQVNSYYNSNMGFLGQKIGSHDLHQDFLNLSTQYPGGLPQIQNMIAGASNSTAALQEVTRINNIMQGEFDPVLTTQYKKAALNGIYSVTYGNTFRIFHGHQLGVIAGASYYHRTTDIDGGTLNQYSLYQGILTGNPAIDNNSPRMIPNYITPNTLVLGKYVGQKEYTGTESLNYGFLGGLAYRFNQRNQVSFQYLGSQGGETQASYLTGQYDYTYNLSGPVYNTAYSLKQTFRTLNTYNFQGEHKIGKGEFAPRLSYNLATSRATENDPDYRFVNLIDYRPVGGSYYGTPPTVPGQGGGYAATPDIYSLLSGYVDGYGPYGKIQVDPNGRRYRNMTETNYNHKVDLTVPFPLGGLTQVFKAGFNYLHRDRNFTEHVLSLPGSNFSSEGAYPLYLVNGNLNELVGSKIVGIQQLTSPTGEGAPLVGGFLYNSQKSPNNYQGFYETNAFYGMLDLKLQKNLRLTGGVRFEKTNIQSAVDTSNVYISPSLKNGSVNLVYVNPNSGYKTNYKPYYSANLTYTLSEKMNFRLAYSTTLARPEIRELTNVYEYDPYQQALVVGNPDLTNQETTNYDFRWEWFPKSGEVLSASAFYKQINHQLEKVFILNSAGLSATYPEFPAVEFQNDPNTGYVEGIELEVVKDLGKVWKPLTHFFLGSNVMFANSEVVKNPQRLNADRIMDRNSPSKSPLFEQAPYSVNAYINYANPHTGTDVTVTFNEVGERLIQVNLDGTPDLYSRPAPILDIVFSQMITKRLQFKGYAKNALNPSLNEVYANPGNGGKYYGHTYIRRSYQKGSEIMLGLTYHLF
ncbi:TonB-dependent receptor domain-containing protein [Dinghuibacter silviterrae]|uniref:TonB-dependent receptor n=1 Tax=Dinghuibacter silviterrae TaxID=1539049 RepID=A0A4R8DSC0_9BACT|nr:TonB-dependent receptor [Dinghuibacter silviterrae]TDX00756.1 TonB-dependent receptor [Dinghuibacter silviterrae]